MNGLSRKNRGPENERRMKMLNFFFLTRKTRLRRLYHSHIHGLMLGGVMTNWCHEHGDSLSRLHERAVAT